MAIEKWNDLQLSFDLDLDEVDADAQERSISHMEAMQISEASRQTFEGLEEAPAYFNDYLRLVEKGWPWRVATYIAWAASPRNERWPKTLGELATQVLGLTGPRQIHTWRKKYPTIDAVTALMQAAPLFEHRRDVIEALIASATKPDYKNFNDRKLFLEMIGDYTPKSRLDIGKAGKADEITEKSDDELRRWLGEEGLKVEGDRLKVEDEDDAG